MRRLAAVLAPLLLAWLCGCLVSASVGDHDAGVAAPSQADGASASSAPDAGAEPAAPPVDLEPAPQHEVQAPPTEAAPEPPEQAAQEDPTPAPTEDEPMPQAADEMPVDEPEQPPAQELPVEQEPAPLCQETTDDPCLHCQQDACCAQRQACLAEEGCHCLMECRFAEQPGACAETCLGSDASYEPWVLCIEDACPDACAT